MDAYLLELAREGLLLALLLSAPPVLASLAAALAVGAMQTATQLQDPTLSAVPRLLAAALALWVASPWIGEQALRFTQTLLSALPALAQQVP